MTVAQLVRRSGVSGVALRREAGAASLMVPMLLVAAVAFASAALGVGVRATFGAHVAVDETQYVLTALSLAEDGNLDITDELAAERWHDFADVEPPAQTEVLADGRQISPHDPLLPVLLTIPVGAAGWVGAKLAMASLAALLAALMVWVAVRRFAVPARLATIAVGIAAASAPLAVYGQQIYPELPAALVVLVAVAALTGRRRPRDLVLVGVAVTALPWLSIKYVPVAAAVAVVAVVQWWRGGRPRVALAFAGGLVVMGAVYLGTHRLVWGGWTVYASGDHFQESGEFGAVGFEPSYTGRALRLVGLFVDREYGIAAWQPAWLLLLPAIGWLLLSRPSAVPNGRRAALVVPLVAGWLVATFVAVTMHGFWWPGRQLVVVLPLALLVMLRWLTAASRRPRAIAVGLGVVGVFAYACLLVDGYEREITWVSQFQRVDNPLYQAYDALLPDYRGDFWPLHIAWIGALVLLMPVGVRSVAQHERDHKRGSR